MGKARREREAAGSVPYDQFPGFVDAYGRPVRYRTVAGMAPNRAKRRSVGIRSPLWVLLEYQQKMQEMQALAMAKLMEERQEAEAAAE